MTVKQLKQKLEQYPDDMDVFLAGGKTEFQFGLLNSVRKQEVRFHDFTEEVEAFEECVILDEE